MGVSLINTTYGPVESESHKGARLSVEVVGLIDIVYRAGFLTELATGVVYTSTLPPRNYQ